MADVSWTGNHEEDFAVMRNLVGQHELILGGNGRPGLPMLIEQMNGKLDSFMAAHQAREQEVSRALLAREEDAERHARARRWRIGIVTTVITTLFAVILAWLLSIVIPAAKAIMDDYYQRHPSALVQHSLSDALEPAYAKNRPEISHY